MTNKNSSPDLVSNKQAFHDFEIMETFEAGIALLGSEVKSLRNHHGSLKESYITVQDHELWLINSSITPYRFGSSYNHEEKRKRKLLMHSGEIQKLKKQVKEKGFSLIPLCFYLKKGKIKLKIAIAKGKKLYDKRSVLKEKEAKRQIQRELKQR